MKRRSLKYGLFYAIGLLAVIMFASALCFWIIPAVNGKWEATATAANIFGREKYAYTTFDGVSSGSYRYAIRPRNILLGASWKF